MTSFRRILRSSGLALLLLAVPIVVGAQNDGTHRNDFPEYGSARIDGVADYAMIQLDELETIAGRQHLDSETIRFLEANLWLPEPIAEYAAVGGAGHIGPCQGEGLLAHSDRAAFVEAFGPIELYCSPTARYATYESDSLLPVGDVLGDQMGFY